MSESRCPLRYIGKLLLAHKACGGDISHYLTQLGVDETQLTDSQITIPLARHHELSLHIIDHATVPGFGLEEGKLWSALDFGMVGFAAFSSATLRDAIKVYTQYQDLVYPMATCELQLHDDDAQLVWSVTQREYGCTPKRLRFVIEDVYVQWMLQLPQHFGADKGWIRVSVHREPVDTWFRA